MKFGSHTTLCKWEKPQGTHTLPQIMTLNLLVHAVRLRGRQSEVTGIEHKNKMKMKMLISIAQCTVRYFFFLHEIKMT